MPGIAASFDYGISPRAASAGTRQTSARLLSRPRDMSAMARPTPLPLR